MVLKAIVTEGRERLNQGRQRARASHDSGTPGRQVATLLSDLYDDIILEVYEAAIEQHGGDRRRRGGNRRHRELALVAHGGLGRCDVSPYSDADLMLLTTRRGESLAAEVAGTLTRDLGDIGIEPGLAIRRSGEACQLAYTDPKVFTSLAESRFVAGSYHRYRRFYDRFRQGANRRRHRLVDAVVDARQTERRKWGETAYMLRPNVKRSRGGMRDAQSIGWIGFAEHGESSLPQLVSLGLLPAEDFRLVQAAYDFYLSLRHDLHFRAGKASDILDRHLQLDIAKSWGYTDVDGALAVEQFMSDFFEHVRNVRYAVAYVVEESSHYSSMRRVTEWLRSSRVCDDIRVGPTRIWVVPDRIETFTSSPTNVMRLMAAANHHDRRIDHQSWRSIRRAFKQRRLEQGQWQPPVEPAAVESFRELLNEPNRLAPVLRRMHDLRIIEWLMPPFGRIRGMLQFNAYHKYTVDAHSIRAVEAATSWRGGEKQVAKEPVGAKQIGEGNEPDQKGGGAVLAGASDAMAGIRRRYHRITNKWLLHLTLLIHDIGKGFEEDHCIVGERMAGEIAERLGLADDDRDLMAWLVRHHLIVNDFAFRHDLNDPQIVLEFASIVGSIRRLEWLVVHTVADLTAVGPGVATDWKLNLIEDLYRRTRRYFDSAALPGSPNDPEVESRRRAVIEILTSSTGPADDLVALVDELPLSLLSRHDVETLAEVVAATKSLGQDQTLWVRGRADQQGGGTHFTILRRESASATGTFAHSAGVMSALGLTIRRAQIERYGEFAWNDFWVTDMLAPDDTVHPERIVELENSLRRLLIRDVDQLPSPPRLWTAAGRHEGVRVLPTRVTFDNETIDRFTILSLFAYDQPTLLHRVTSRLANLGLVLQFAKIDTHLDQIADVFYLTTADGQRITDPSTQSTIREALLQEAEWTAEPPR